MERMNDKEGVVHRAGFSEFEAVPRSQNKEV
jgi:hypothetical protein